ncbi:hypothetical protein E2P86_07045 [Sphingobacterium psychroaquaticum]|uniref:hypothetical protein n=1 Tax=Sphingobacterium psychroaquaticum TaxID=561061 RepID=UPI00106C4CD8|nr:hypothetical protein [Sphingobacterium psychroaquaticum]QBQ40917.1 hypothetical protein E2P86_07045 [Sphingobacterium psychroaquaticum]
MFTYLLPLHSWIRWFVLAALLVAIVRGYYAWRHKKEYTKTDNALRHWTATILHIQLILGLWLYSISPIVRYFIQNFQEGVRMREIRFFGMEHSLMMLIAVVVVTIGSAKAKRKSTSAEKFKTMTIWYSIGLLIILSSVPWEFSPLTSRPSIRYF